MGARTWLKGTKTGWFTPTQGVDSRLCRFQTDPVDWEIGAGWCLEPGKAAP